MRTRKQCAALVMVTVQWYIVQDVPITRGVDTLVAVAQAPRAIYQRDNLVSVCLLKSPTIGSASSARFNCGFSDDTKAIESVF